MDFRLKWRVLFGWLAGACAAAASATLVCARDKAVPAIRYDAIKNRDTIPHPETTAEKQPFIHQVCGLLEREAVRTGLPKGFLARLIWKESRFNPNAVSPKGAQGIAQFMPGTAKLRGLEDPFDPQAAITASARYLADLKTQFGTLGFAAAAYNAGENRVSRWLAGATDLPYETRDFVISITGYSAADWKANMADKPDYRLDKKAPFQAACRKLPARPAGFNVVARPTANWQPWGVQVAANFRRAIALKLYDRVRARHQAVIKNRAPMIVLKVNKSRGRQAMYSVRLGAPSRAEALTLCKQLRARGGACVVVRN